MVSQRSRGQPLITPRLCRSRYQISMVARRSITLYDINGIYHTHKILVPEEELEEDMQEIKKPEGDNETETEANIMQRVLKQAAKIGN